MAHCPGRFVYDKQDFSSWILKLILNQPLVWYKGEVSVAKAVGAMHMDTRRGAASKLERSTPLLGKNCCDYVGGQ